LAGELTFRLDREYCASFVVIWYRIAATLNKQLKGRRAQAMNLDLLRLRFFYARGKPGGDDE